MESSNKNSYIQILVVLLIIASFFLGMLVNKVQYLEKSSQTLGTQTQVAQQQLQISQTQNPKVTLSTIKNLFGRNLIKFGNANNKLLFVEIADPSCPYCHAASGKNADLNKQLGERFQLSSDGGSYQAPVEEMRKLVNQGKASFVYIYQNGHGNGEMAMKALYCAYDAGKFWEAHDKLMTNAGYTLINNEIKNDKKNTGKIVDFLKDAADPNSLEACLNSGKYNNRISSDIQISNSLGARGTPGFFINETNFSGAYSWTDMKSAADSALN